MRGREKDERIDVTVDMYIELQAPPEHMVSGIDNEENTFNSTYLNNELTLGFSGSMKLR